MRTIIDYGLIFSIFAPDLKGLLRFLFYFSTKKTMIWPEKERLL